MKIISTKHPEVKIIKPTVFEDHRGFFMETFHMKKMQDIGININFVQDNHARSKKNTLRGLHYQRKYPQAKLVRCIQGHIFDVAVDIRKESVNFGKWVGQELSEENKLMLYVPEGFAHGYYVYSESADIYYKCSNFFYPEYDACLRWDDPNIGINWPSKNPILSDKDRFAPKIQSVTKLID